MGKLLTVKAVMKIIPLGRTSVTKIIKSMPHVDSGGKLMIEEDLIVRWIRSHTVYPEEQLKAAKTKTRKLDPAANGHIPYRHTGRTSA